MNRTIQKYVNLEFFSVIYDLLEAYLAILFGSMARSIALVAFGFDSVMESLAGMVLFSWLSLKKELTSEAAVRRKRLIMRTVAWAFLVLGAVLFYETVKRLAVGEPARPSLPGMILALVSLIITPLLTVTRNRSHSREENQGNKFLMRLNKLQEAESYLIVSFVLLVGLSINYFSGWWRADGVAALIIVAFIFKKGIETALKK